MVSLVGILNMTPDSFSDGGNLQTTAQAIAYAEQLFDDGAEIIDVGGESTNPTSRPITPAQELARIHPILEVLIPKYPGKISIDSHHPETLQQIAGIGPFIINDVTGCNNPEMVRIASLLQLPIIVSHLPAKFGTDIVAAHRSTQPLTRTSDVRRELLDRKNQLIQAGVPAGKIILDPGIGFGKSMELNDQLVEFSREVPKEAVMIGYSRKRFLGDKRMELELNVATGRRAVQAGVRYLRVHDVAGHHKLTEEQT